MSEIDPRIEQYIDMRNHALRAFQDYAPKDRLNLQLYASGKKDPAEMTLRELAWAVYLGNEEPEALELQPVVQAWREKHGSAWSERLTERARLLFAHERKASGLGEFYPEAVFLMQMVSREAIDVLIFNIAASAYSGGHCLLEVTQNQADSVCELRRWDKGDDGFTEKTTILFDRNAQEDRRQPFYKVTVPAPLGGNRFDLVCFYSALQIRSRAVTHDAAGRLRIGPQAPQRS